jgi:hypothetical protein
MRGLSAKRTLELIDILTRHRVAVDLFEQTVPTQDWAAPAGLQRVRGSARDREALGSSISR